MTESKHIVITGGAGYLGAYLTGELLRSGYYVTVIDDLLYGGDSLLTYLSHPNFHFFKADLWEPRVLRSSLRDDWPKPEALVHLAAIAGFPACQSVGRQVAWRYNVEATEHAFEQADKAGIDRFVFLSTYSSYGASAGGELIDEKSDLNPQSLYAETKVAAEQLLLEASSATCFPVILRLTDAYGLSPRTRFDVILNQFVWEAYSKQELMIYQRGYSRSFIHVADSVQGIMLVLEASNQLINKQIYNLGDPQGNRSKDDLVKLILKRLPETTVQYKDLTFGGDRRDLSISFEKFFTHFEFTAQKNIDEGIKEVLDALQQGLIKNPTRDFYRNARFIVQ
jgi:nucleoside-diphosphate-sugar epimerase